MVDTSTDFLTDESTLPIFESLTFTSRLSSAFAVTPASCFVFSAPTCAVTSGESESKPLRTDAVEQPDIEITPTATVIAMHISLSFIIVPRSEEHTSELQSRFDLVCRLLL